MEAQEKDNERRIEKGSRRETKGMRKKFKGGGRKQRDKKLEWDEKEREKT